MKKIRLGIFVIATMCIIMVPQLISANNPTVMVANYKIDPEVLIPGDVGTIIVTIRSAQIQATQTETRDSENETITTTTSLSAYIKNIDFYGRDIEFYDKSCRRARYSRIGGIGPGQEFTITIPIKASCGPGTYYPEIYIEIEDGKSVRYPIPVKVDSSGIEIVPLEATTASIPLKIPVRGSREINLCIASRRPNLVHSIIIEPKAEGIILIPDKRFIDKLGPYESSKVNFTIYPISVGKKDIHFYLTYKNGDNLHYERLEMPIKVEGDPNDQDNEEIFEERKPIIIVSEYSEATTSPGSSRNITLTILNYGSGVAEKTKVVLDTENLPFSIIGSGNQFYVGDLNPGETYKIVVNLAVDEKVEEKIYDLPIKIFAENGYSTTERVGISVFSKITLSEIKITP